MKKHLKKVHYLGEPRRGAQEAVAGNVPRNSYTEKIIGQVDVCPYPEPQTNVALTSSGRESNELIHSMTQCDVCPPPRPPPPIQQKLLLETFSLDAPCILSSTALDRDNLKLRNFTLIRDLKVTKGNLNEIVASILSPP